MAAGSILTKKRFSDKTTQNNVTATMRIIDSVYQYLC